MNNSFILFDVVLALGMRKVLAPRRNEEAAAKRSL